MFKLEKKKNTELLKTIHSKQKRRDLLRAPELCCFHRTIGGKTTTTEKLTVGDDNDCSLMNQY